MALEDSIREWVVIDNQIRSISEQLRSLREKRGTVSDQVLSKAEEAGVMSARVNVSDGYLRFAQVKTTPPLSLTYVEGCLKRCISEPTQVDRIMKYIKDARNSRSETAIRRVVQNQGD